MEQSKLVATKIDLVKIKNVLNSTDVIEACTKKEQIQSGNSTNSQMWLFSLLYSEVPLGCKDAVPEPLTMNHTVFCLTYEKNTRILCKDNLFLFRALASHLHGKCGLEEETSRMFTLFIGKIGGTNPATFQVVCMKDFPNEEDLAQVNILPYDIDFEDGAMIGELAWKSVGKQSNTVRLLCYNNHICYVSGINILFKAYRRPSCDTIFNRAPNLEQHLTTCTERIKQVYPKTMYQLCKTLFD